ncbi:MAG TPA: hypothetical protein VN736_10680 [Candidatus Limnocylindrales bacterium]|nr:hypothetical protein [Candidatus Limnocylindrales bacterium]
MGIGFAIGGMDVALGPEGDLAKCLAPGINTVLHFKDTLRAFENIPATTLSAVPAGSIGFSIDRTARWIPHGTNVVLSFRPELAGRITFAHAGSLITYRDAEQAPFSIVVPDGCVYVSVAFEVSMAVSGGGAFSAGSFGVSANLSQDDTFTIANHRCFQASGNAFAAVREALERFTLPFSPSAIDSLGPDDVLEYQFLGKLGLGFGLSYGLTTPLLGGRSMGELGRSLNTPLATFAFTARPAASVGASFAVTYNHEDAFRFVFRRGSRQSSAILTIFRMDTGTLSFKTAGSLTVTAGAAGNVTPKTEQLLDSAVGRAFAGLDGTAVSALKSKLTAAGNGIVNKLTERANDAIRDLTNKTSGKAGLELIHETATTDTALFQLTFDLQAPNVIDGAIRLAMEGRIADAAVFPGVALAPGCLIEHSFHQRTALTFEFFDLWRWTDAVDYVNNIETVYAGNGLLKLIGTAGVTHTSGIVGHQAMCNVHFRASVQEGATADAVSNLSVHLCFELSDQTRDDAAATCRILRACANDRLAAAADEATAFMQAHGGRLATTCAFSQDVFHRFTADKYTNGHPPPPPHSEDARNYAAFRDAAVATLGQWLGFEDYAAWAAFNRVAIDQEGSTMLPDRRHSGNLAVWPAAVAGPSDSARRTLCRYWSESAREFMNLVDDLGLLCQELDEVETDQAFHRLLAELNGIIKNEVPVDFLKAVLLALISIGAVPVTGSATKAEGALMTVSLVVAEAA